MPPKALTLYAQWVANSAYTVGGTVSGLSGSGLVLQNNGGGSNVATIPPTGYTFPHGLFKFTLTQCTVGSTVTFTIHYPALLTEGTRYWKYGSTPDQAEHWYLFSQAAINGNTVTFNLTDGGLGDNDLKADGTISDFSGPAVPAADIPTLSEWAMILLASLLFIGGAWRIRRQSIG